MFRNSPDLRFRILPSIRFWQHRTLASVLDKEEKRVYVSANAYIFVYRKMVNLWKLKPMEGGFVEK
jgi:hypothetical protein